MRSVRPRGSGQPHGSPFIVHLDSRIYPESGRGMSYQMKGLNRIVAALRYLLIATVFSLAALLTRGGASFL
jgi:hypothetical protein